jgi:uncharacterized protein YbcI
VFRHARFFTLCDESKTSRGKEKKIVAIKVNPSVAQQIAQVAMSLQQQRTGHAPESVSVVLSEDTLVVTLHGALTKAEKSLAQSPEGASRVQEFHRQLFSSSSEVLREEIKKITGVEVREAAAEVETATGAMVQAFTTGTMVQVFLLKQKVALDTWTENGPGKTPTLEVGKV